MPLLLLGIAIGILIGFIVDKYIFPYLDIKFEKYTYRESVICTQYQVDAQKIAKENSEDQELQPAIGFQISDSTELDDEDDCEDKKIGFKL